MLEADLQYWLVELDQTLKPSKGTLRERGDRLARIPAESITLRPVLCDLARARAAVLEHNVSTEVAIEHKNASAGVCTGTMLTDPWVLTAYPLLRRHAGQDVRAGRLGPCATTLMFVSGASIAEVLFQVLARMLLTRSCGAEPRGAGSGGAGGLRD
ncbi:hypothetical protein AB0L75_24705 [Streptomyces sp. NPDC052101]|uniref:hypothetical protein n=1 Tax=Streptomyces sp. NPDC052101 TaxID=3155763 RepID=UPI0034172E99